MTPADSGGSVCRVVAAQAPRKPQSSSAIQQRRGPHPLWSVSGSQTGWEGPLHLAGSHTMTPPLSPLSDQNVVYPVRIESSSESLANGRTLDLQLFSGQPSPPYHHLVQRGQPPKPAPGMEPARGGSMPGGVARSHGNREELRRAPSVLIQSFNIQRAFLLEGPWPVLGTQRGVPLAA